MTTTIKAILFSGGPAWLFVKVVTLTFGVISLYRLLPARNRQVPNFRPRHGVTLALVLAAATVGTGAGVSLALHGVGRVTATKHPHKAYTEKFAATASLPAGSPYLGVFENGEESSWASISKFGAAVGRQPDIVLCFQQWNAGFPLKFADTASSHGAVLFIHLLPKGVSMAAVAHGRYDAYLESYAAEAHRYGGQVLLSFAPEMNGDWYSWGWSRSSPADYVLAWRHVVTLFRDHGASNVIWLWVVNRISPWTGPLKEYWPGASYVDWVGYDDYIYNRSETFQTVDTPTIAAIRELTSKPIMLSETGVGQMSGASAIRDLVAGANREHLLGLVWFDERQAGDIYHQDWHLEDNPVDVAAMRQALAAYMPSFNGRSRPGRPSPAP